LLQSTPDGGGGGFDKLSQHRQAQQAWDFRIAPWRMPGSIRKMRFTLRLSF
jgi:hypothetical protein